MRQLFIISAIALSLGACATGPSAYGPNTDGLGFSQSKIENDRFRVAYTGRSEAEAQDYALLRAAELTLDEGYSHFRIIDGRLSGNGGGSGVSTSIGVGVGRYGGRRGYGRRSSTNVGIGIGIHDIARAMAGDKVRNDIEIKLLNSGQNSGQALNKADNVYDARSIVESIQPELFQ